jgi:hypothetical protein
MSLHQFSRKEKEVAYSHFQSDLFTSTEEILILSRSSPPDPAPIVKESARSGDWEELGI